MPDVFSRRKRSEVMSRIRGKNTKPEVAVRSLLHRLGYRFRIHSRAVPGNPDILLRRHHAAIFVHGCFWHKHECHLFKWPTSNPDFWHAKIKRNEEVDRRSVSDLMACGFRVLVVWECALKGRSRLTPDQLSAELDAWLKSTNSFGQISGSE